MLLALPTAAPAPVSAYHAPRTPDGAPDLQGGWTNLSLTFLERPGRFKTLVLPEKEAAAYERMANDPVLSRADQEERRKRSGRPAPPDVGARESEWFEPLLLQRIDGEPRTSVITDPSDGQLPYTPAAHAVDDAARRREMRAFDNPEDRTIEERCLMEVAPGPPLGSIGVNAAYRIVQTPGEIVLASEMMHDVRHIRMNAAHGPAALHPWMGDSVGAWQGETLRVETTHFSPAQAFEHSGGHDFMISQEAVVTEWFTRVSATQIRYRFQVDDAALYTRPWRGEMMLTASAAPMLEYACHEGNYALSGILAGARRWESEGRTPEPLDGGDPPPKPAAAVPPAR